MKLVERITAIGLVCALAAPEGLGQSFELAHRSLFAMQAMPQSASTSREPLVRRLRVVPLEGQGVTNIITSRTNMPLVVTIFDENDRPVEGATVTFELPTSGPSGVFPNQQTTLTTTSDARGQAGTLDFLPNDKPGRFEIRVTAKLQEAVGNLILRQANYFSAEDRAKAEPKPLLRNWKFWAIAGGALAGGIVAAVLLTRDGPAPIAVSAGPVTFVGTR